MSNVFILNSIIRLLSTYSGGNHGGK